MAVQTEAISTAFIWRRIHSLMGLWLVLYLFMHLIVNSQATLWIGDDGSGFVRMVDSLESLPYLQVIEMVFIGIPLAIHMVWGVQRIWTARTNSSSSNGSKPSLNLSRNQAFTWQRLTSWILLVGIIGHVVQMRFIDMPKEVVRDYEKQYLVPIYFDGGLLTLAPRLKVILYTPDQIAELKEKAKKASEGEFSPQSARSLDEIQKRREELRWIEKLSSYDISEDQVIAVAPDPGKAMLLMVRNTFKNPWMAVLYTIFVLAAAFHAFNGFWTSLITWGAILSYRSQKAMLPVAWVGITLLAFLGLAAIWGSYWINLRT